MLSNKKCNKTSFSYNCDLLDWTGWIHREQNITKIPNYFCPAYFIQDSFNVDTCNKYPEVLCLSAICLDVWCSLSARTHPCQPHRFMCMWSPISKTKIQGNLNMNYFAKCEFWAARKNLLKFCVSFVYFIVHIASSSIIMHGCRTCICFIPRKFSFVSILFIQEIETCIPYCKPCEVRDEM